MKFFFTSVLVLLSVILPGCDAPREPLRMVSSPWPGYEPIYLARDLGYLDADSVRLSELPSANIAFEAFSNGSADIATLTLDETLTLMSQGRKLHILMVVDISNGADAVIAKPSIKTMSALKGKRIAMENIPLGVYILNRSLEIAGLKESDVSVVPMPEDKHLKAYQQGRIDAAVTMEPYLTHLVKAGAHVLFDSSKIPNEIFDLLVAREDVFQKRQAELCSIVQQWFRAFDYATAYQQDAVARMSKRLGIGEQTFRTMTEGLILPGRQENLHLLGGKEPAFLQPARKLASTMYKEHMLGSPVDVASSIDTQFMAACLKQ